MNVRLLKIVALVALGFVLALAAGWLWGAAGRWSAERRLAATELHLRLTDARSRILGARVDLYSLNFGSAAQNLEAARAVLASTAQAMEAADTKDVRIEHLRAAMVDLEASQRLAAQMRQDAHAPADRAAQAVSVAARPQP